jgi:predicted patatin/cPLA2 family phospholipase
MGTLADDPAAGDTSFQLTVKHANHLGRLYAKAANPVSVSLDAKTRLRKDGKSASVDALSQNDRAIVLAKVCRSDLKAAVKASSTLPALTARLVLAKSAKS